MDNEIIDIIEGFFTRSIYKSDNYMVSLFKTNDGTITTTGPNFDYDLNQKYVLTGNYVEHYKYGFQFNIHTFEKYIPTQKEEIISFLKSKTFKGIGKSTAEKIYEYFGDETINILKENPERIFELDLTNKQLESLDNGFKSLNDPENEIMFYLISNGFNNIDAQKIFTKFKLATIEIGDLNPFRFYNEVEGMSFEKVKSFASKKTFEDSENKYKEAFIIYLITEYCFNTGDTYILRDILIDILNKYGTIDNFDEIIDRSVNNNYLIVEGERIYLFDDYNDEQYIANYLNHLDNSLVIDELLINEAIDSSEKELNIKYDNLQKEAIKSFFINNISIIVGGPGTGKTTIVKTMCKMFNDLFPYNNLIVVAPTGRAAKRINEICNVEAKTIHSLLRWNKETNTFVYDANNPIVYDAIIIDEFSMVDSNLFACLLKAGSMIKKIAIIGDDNQLPSIRPGNVLNDLIESNRFNVTHLNINFRQTKGNEIINLSNDIINNKIDLNRYSKDICFIDIKKQNIDLISLIKKDIENGYSLDEIQVLTPMYKGEWGIDNLNILMQQAFNPSSNNKKEKETTKYIFRENDKILQLKNRPTDDVYNGDIGILKEVNLKEKYLLVDYQGIPCFYSYDELIDISLAYTMSVHKAQGSEYQIVYFIISRNNLYMLDKKLIYTAISRAKTKLVIIGEESIFMQGINRISRKRNTTLINFINNSNFI